MWQTDSGWAFRTESGQKLALNEIGYNLDDWCKISEKITEYRSIKHNQERNVSQQVNSQTNVIIFKPQYESKLLFAIVVMIGIVSILWLVAANDLQSFYQKETEVFVALLVWTFFILIIPFVLVKRVLLADRIEIERYFLPKRVIEYRDLTDISMFAIHSKKGKIAINRMKNAHVLADALKQKMDEGRISEHQIEGKEYAKELISLKAAMYSVPITVLLLVLLPITGYKSFLKYPLFASLGIFTLSYLAIYLTMKNRTSE